MKVLGIVLVVLSSSAAAFAGGPGHGRSIPADNSPQVGALKQEPLKGAGLLMALNGHDPRTRVNVPQVGKLGSNHTPKGAELLMQLSKRHRKHGKKKAFLAVTDQAEADQMVAEANEAGFEANVIAASTEGGQGFLVGISLTE